jgi:hypothetical protein
MLVRWDGGTRKNRGKVSVSWKAPGPIVLVDFLLLVLVRFLGRGAEGTHVSSKQGVKSRSRRRDMGPYLPG